MNSFVSWTGVLKSWKPHATIRHTATAATKRIHENYPLMRLEHDGTPQCAEQNKRFQYLFDNGPINSIRKFEIDDVAHVIAHVIVRWCKTAQDVSTE